MAKHKFASISLTVRDRAISLKFSTHRVSKECNLCNFPKIVLLCYPVSIRIYYQQGGLFLVVLCVVDLIKAKDSDEDDEVVRGSILGKARIAKGKDSDTDSDNDW